jgi:hypothetical protein
MTALCASIRPRIRGGALAGPNGGLSAAIFPHGAPVHRRYVLLKERNMLHTEKLRARAAGGKLQNPFRLQKVRRHPPVFASAAW